MRIRLNTLGPIELTRGDDPALARRRKELGLLTYLARRAPRRVQRAALAAMLWGDVDETRSRRSLRQALSDLRDVLGETLVADQESVRLGSGITLDAAEFEADVAAERWAAAIARWRGPFLEAMEELGDEEWRAWIEAERAGLGVKLAHAYRQLIARSESAGERETVIRLAAEWSERFPHDEEPIGCLLTGLVAARRLPEAEARYAVFAERLRQDLGIEPTPHLQSLFEEVPPIGGPGVRGLLSADLVGRAGELGVLRNGWERVLRGEGVAAVIDGDEGLGKTRLLAELARELRARSAKSAVIDTRAFAAEVEPGAFARVLIGRLAALPGAAAVPPASLAALAQLAPELAERFPAVEPAAATDRLEPHLIRLVTEVGAEQPLAILVDDAPVADESSRAALLALARRPPAGCLLVLAGRGQDWADSGSVEDLGGGAVEGLALQPLSPREVGAAIGSMAPFDERSLAELTEIAVAQTGGVPGQVVTLVTALADSGAIAPDVDGAWRATRPIAEAPLPGVLRGAMEARLAQLSADARTLVEGAAVLGPRVEPRLLEAMCGLSAAEFQGALGSVLGRRLLREDPISGELEFGSDANRQLVYRLLAPSRREALHRSAARALAERGGSPAAVAEHRRLGGPDPSRARRVRLIGAGLVAVAGLSLGAAWYARSTAARVAPGTGVLLADVANRTGDSIFDRTLYSAALVSLQESGRVWVVSRTRFPEVLARMRRTDTVVDGVLAQEIALRENLPVVAELAIDGRDPDLLLTGRLVDARTGRDLRAFQVRARGQGEVLGAIDRLTGSLRRALGDAPPAIGPGDTLPLVSTSSLEALRAYTEGLRAWGRADYERARDSWLRAVQQDSAFPLAYLSLVDHATRRGNDPAGARRYLEAARRFADRLTARERLLLDFQTAFLAGDRAAALAAQQALAERYPSPASLYNLGTALLQFGRCAEAIPVLERTAAMAPGYTNAWINLATCRQATGQLEPALEAYAAAERADSMALIRDNINHEWGQVFLKLGRVAAAESAFRRILSNPEPTNQARGHRSLAYLAMFRGRYRDAATELDRAIGLSRGAGVEVTLLRNLVIAAHALISAGQEPVAASRLDQARALLLAREYLPDYFDHLGAGYLRLGRVGAAEELLRQLRSQLPTPTPVQAVHIRRLEARLALATGRPERALELLAVAPPPTTAPTAVWAALRGEAYAAAGRPDSALQAWLSVREIWNWGFEGQEEWVRAPFRIGQLAEQVGDTGLARTAYSELLDRWAAGDSALAELVAARERLARLQPASR